MAKQLTKETLKRGDVIGYQFGWSMTLYEFYQVIGIKGSTVSMIPLKTKDRPYGFMQVEVEPIKRNCYLQKEVTTKRFNKYGNLTLGGTGRHGHQAFICEKGETFCENHAD